MNILITGGRAPVALELARVFHRAGHTVFMAESLRGHLSQPSAAVKANFLVPAPRQETGAFLEALKKIVAQNQIDLLIPTCEEVFHIARGLDDIPCCVFTEPLDKLDSFHNKWKFFNAASSCGLRVPETMLIENEDDLRTAFDRWHGLVLKPVYSRFASRTLILPQLREALSMLTFDAKQAWMAQEFITGQQFCTYSVCQRGRITAHATYPTVFTAGQGATIAFEHVDHPVIFEWVKTFVEHFDVTGQLSFDFIQSPAGEVYALECNPRATSGVHLLASHPQFVDSFRAEPTEPITPLGDKKMLASAMLVYGLPSALADSISNHGDTEARRLKEKDLHGKGFSDWLQTFLQSRDVIWDAKDPLPFLLQFRSLLFYLKLASQRGMSPLEASTFDIEWNGER